MKKSMLLVPIISLMLTNTIWCAETEKISAPAVEAQSIWKIISPADIKTLVQKQNISDFTIADIHTIDNNLYILGEGWGSFLKYIPQKKIILLKNTPEKTASGEIEYKIDVVGIYNKPNDATNIKLTSIAEKPIITTVINNKTHIYKEKDALFKQQVGSQLVELAVPSSLANTLFSITSSSGPEYWICTYKECALYNQNMVIPLPFNVTMVGAAPPIDAGYTYTYLSSSPTRLRTYWVIEKNVVKMVTINQNREKPIVGEDSFILLDPTITYTIQQLRPYTATEACALLYTKSNQPVIALFQLNKETLTYTIQPLEIAKNIKNIAITLSASGEPLLYILEQRPSLELTIKVAKLGTLIQQVQDQKSTELFGIFQAEQPPIQQPVTKPFTRQQKIKNIQHLESLRLPITVDYKNAVIEEFISFCFIKTHCYALARINPEISVPKTAIIRIDMSSYNDTSSWQYIDFPISPEDIRSLFSLGSYLGILVYSEELEEIDEYTEKKPTRIFESKPHSHIYIIRIDNIKKLLQAKSTSGLARIKKAASLALTNFGLEKIYSTEKILKSCSGYIKAGTEQQRTLVIAAKPMDDQKSVILLRQSQVGQKTDVTLTKYMHATLTPSGDYIWLLEFPKNNSTKLFITGLENMEDIIEGFFEVEADIANIPSIESFIALDQDIAYFTNSNTHMRASFTQTLYQLNNKGTIIAAPIPLKQGVNNTIGTFNNKLITALDTNLYYYIPPVMLPEQTIILPPAVITPREEQTIIQKQTKTLTPPLLTMESSETATVVPPLNTASDERLASAVRKTPPLNIVRPPKPQAQQGTQQPKAEMPRPSFTPQQKNYLMNLYRSPLFQKMIKTVVGDSIYNSFLKTKTAYENEVTALNTDPKPWEKYLIKPSYIQQSQNWLYKNTRGFLGKMAKSTLERYDFPENTAGKRAQLLYTLYNIEGDHYKDTWLKKTVWDNMSNIAKNALRDIDGHLPEFGEYWLQPKTYVPGRTIAPAA